jgi:hypothetical protein
VDGISHNLKGDSLNDNNPLEWAGVSIFSDTPTFSGKRTGEKH